MKSKRWYIIALLSLAALQSTVPENFCSSAAASAVVRFVWHSACGIYDGACMWCHG